MFFSESFFPENMLKTGTNARNGLNNWYVYKKCNAFRKNFLENRENRENKNVWTISAEYDNFVKINEISQFREIKRHFCLNPSFRCKQMKKVMKCHIQYNEVENMKSVIYNLLSIWKITKKRFLNRATRSFLKYKKWCVIKLLCYNNQTFSLREVCQSSYLKHNEHVTFL